MILLLDDSRRFVIFFSRQLPLLFVVVLTFSRHLFLYLTNMPSLRPRLSSSNHSHAESEDDISSITTFVNGTNHHDADVDYSSRNETSSLEENSEDFPVLETTDRIMIDDVIPDGEIAKTRSRKKHA
jgi:hypothetical protein